MNNTESRSMFKSAGTGVQINANFDYAYQNGFFQKIVILSQFSDWFRRVFETEDVMFVNIPNLKDIMGLFELDSEQPMHSVIMHYKGSGLSLYRDFTEGGYWPNAGQVFINREYDIRIMYVTVGEGRYMVFPRRDKDKFEKLISTFRLTPAAGYDAADLDKGMFWDADAEILKKDILFFIGSKPWFKKMEMPFKRSYLLYGPPGNGKTSAVRAVAKFFRTSCNTFDFTAGYDRPDATFAEWLANFNSVADSSDPKDDEVPRIRIMLLEDMDRFFPRNGIPHTKVSMSAILNALDGHESLKNTVVIATANHPEDLDRQVLMRPGRFDKRVEFRHPTPENGSLFLQHLFRFQEDVGEGLLVRAADAISGHSYAFHKELFICAAMFAFEDEHEFISEEDLLRAVEVTTKNANDILSTASSIGFSSRKEKGRKVLRKAYPGPIPGEGEDEVELIEITEEELLEEVEASPIESDSE